MKIINFIETDNYFNFLLDSNLFSNALVPIPRQQIIDSIPQDIFQLPSGYF